MDVRCEQCGTGYALDESRLGPEGARVRCSKCGAVFKVDRSQPTVSSPGTPSPPGPARREWKVRARDGSVSTFRELTTLQRWIVERKLVRDDEIGLDGTNWKRLGAVPDLAPFFTVLDRAERAVTLEAELARLQAPAPAPPGEAPGGGAPDLASAVASVVAAPPAPLQPGPNSPAVPASAAPGTPTASAPASAPPATPHPPPPRRSPPVLTPVPPPSPRRPEPAGQAVPDPAFTRASRSGLGVGQVEPDEWEPPRLRWGPGRWLLGLLLLLGLSATGVWAYLKVWLPQESRAQEEQARNAVLEREQKEHEEAQRAAEQRAKQELLQSLAASQGRDAGPSPAPDAGILPRGALDPGPGGPPSPETAPVAEPTPARPGGTAERPAADETQALAAAVRPPASPRRGSPQSFDEWMAEGYRRRTHERAAGALDAYDRALALRPGSAEAHSGRGLALLDLGRRTDALAEFQRALELDPRDGIAVLGMAETYRSLGRTEEARRAYQRYLDGWPGGSEARAARAALESMKE